MVRVHYLDLRFDWWYLYCRWPVEWIFEFDLQGQKNVISGWCLDVSVVLHLSMLVNNKNNNNNTLTFFQ